MDPLDTNLPHITLESLEALPRTGQLIVIIIYSATAIASFLGNSFVLLVLTLDSKLRNSHHRHRHQSRSCTGGQPEMIVHSASVARLASSRLLNNGQTATNVQLVSPSDVTSRASSFRHQHRNDNLRPFLINLALSDLALSMFSTPFTYTDFMLGRWVFPSVFCHLASTINVLAITVSVYTLVLISFDRYGAIVRPLLSSSSFISRHSTLLIGLIWLYAFALASPQIFVTNLEPLVVQNQTYYACREDWPDARYSGFYTTLIFVLTFVLPLVMLLLLVFYSIIAIRISRRDQNLFVQNGGGGKSIRAPDEHLTPALHYRHRSSVKAIRMIITIVIAFFICLSPIQLFYFIIWIKPPTDMHNMQQNPFNPYVLTFFCFYFLFIAHSIVNPLIYCVLCENFQSSVRLFVSKICTTRTAASSALTPAVTND